MRTNFSKLQKSVDGCCVYSQIATLYLRTSGGSPVTKPTQWWQMTIVPHWDYQPLTPVLQVSNDSLLGIRCLLFLDKSVNVSQLTAPLDSLGRPCCYQQKSTQSNSTARWLQQQSTGTVTGVHGKVRPGAVTDVFWLCEPSWWSNRCDGREC